MARDHGFRASTSHGTRRVVTSSSKASFGRWKPAPNPGLSGAFAKNHRLTGFEPIALGSLGAGPEDVAVDAHGALYAGLDSGVIVRVPSGSKTPEVYVSGLKRPLGIEVGPDDTLYVCDAFLGLLRVTRDRRVEVLADSFNGKRFVFTNNLAVQADETVYFTDSSLRYPQNEYRAEVLSHEAGGRLFKYDPRTKDVALVKDGLVFANGVALSRNEDFLVVSDMGRYRLLKLALRGEKAGEWEPFAENLPGFPDNISSDEDGNFWVGMSSLRSGLLDFLLPHPTLREWVARIPEQLVPDPKPYGFVLAFDATGKVIHNLQDPSGTLSDTTAARRFGQDLFVGSLKAPFIGRVKLGGAD